MGTRSKIEALEAEKLELRAKMEASDGRTSKCAKLGIPFKEAYPDDFAEYKKANTRYNQVEEELRPLYVQLKEEEEAEEALAVHETGER